MKKCLCAAWVLLLGGGGAACGDLSEIEDERIRNFVKTAKRVIIEELLTDGNTADEIDDKIDVIVGVLQGDDGGVVSPPSESSCRETGRKTVVMFRDAERHTFDYLGDSSGFSCPTLTDSSTSCRDGDSVCVCETSDNLNPDQATSFAVSCTEDGGDGSIFNFTDAETLSYAAPSGGGGGSPAGSNPGTHSIKEQDQNQKNPGMVFPITVVGSSGAVATPTDQASLQAYDSSNSPITDALATWKTAVDDDIYDVSVGTGEEAKFDVFLVRDTTGVAKIGGTMDATPIDKVTLTAGQYSGAADILAINNAGNTTFMFSGAARTALNAADKVMTYVITDANGEVVTSARTSATATGLRWLDVPSGGSITTAGQVLNVPCVVGQYVMIKIGTAMNRVYLPRCQTQ